SKLGKFVVICAAALVTSAGVATATGTLVGAKKPTNKSAATRLCLNMKKGTLRQLASTRRTCRRGEHLIVIGSTTAAAKKKSAAGLEGPQGPQGSAGQ